MIKIIYENKNIWKRTILPFSKGRDWDDNSLEFPPHRELWHLQWFVVFYHHLKYASNAYIIVQLHKWLCIFTSSPCSCSSQMLFPLPLARLLDFQAPQCTPKVNFLKSKNQIFYVEEILLKKVLIASQVKYGLQKKTLPKAQRTRGLSSYHNFLHKS